MVIFTAKDLILYLILFITNLKNPPNIEYWFNTQSDYFSAIMVEIFIFNVFISAALYQCITIVEKGTRNI